MKFIATDVTDSVERMSTKVAAQQRKPGYALDPYFYRSSVVCHNELSQLVFRSWIYAGHISEIPNPGDYQLFEIGEDSIIIIRGRK